VISFKRGKMIVPNRMPKMNGSSLRKGVNREMKKILVLMVAALMALGLVLPVSAETATKDLIADGRGTPQVVGNLTVASNGVNLVITYLVPAVTDGWGMTETHLYVGTGAPSQSAPGKFPYKKEALADPTTDTYTIAYSEIGAVAGATIFIAAHAALQKPGVDELDLPILLSETAWAAGDTLIGKGKNWATYFTYVLQPVP
jgi:hypothetical protein